jgi:hypothetical protein
VIDCSGYEWHSKIHNFTLGNRCLCCLLIISVHGRSFLRLLLKYCSRISNNTEQVMTLDTCSEDPKFGPQPHFYMHRLKLLASMLWFPFSYLCEPRVWNEYCHNWRCLPQGGYCNLPPVIGQYYMVVLCVIVLCSLVEVYRRFRGACWLQYQGDNPDDAGSKHLWNVGKLPPDCTVLQPRRQPSSYLLLWEPEISLSIIFTWVPTYEMNNCAFRVKEVECDKLLKTRYCIWYAGGYRATLL